MNTLYVMSEDVYLALDGENIVILRDEETVGRFPLHTLENIVSFTYKGASPSLMGACAEKELISAFILREDDFWRASGRSYGNVLLRKEQYRISDDLKRSVLYARNMILGKVFNCRWSLERTIRDNGMRVDAERIKEVSPRIERGSGTNQNL